MQLFRKQALEQVNQREPARALIYGPPGWRTYLAFALTLSVAALFGLTQVDLHRTASVSGWIAPSRGLVTLRPTRPGYVSAVHAQVGDQVRKGQRLFDLTLDADRTQGATGTYYALIEEEHRAVQRRLGGAKRSRELAEKRYASRFESLAREIVAAEHANALQIERVRISATTIIALKQGFERGAVARLDVDKAEAQHLDELREQAALEQHQLRLERDIAALPNERDTELARLSSDVHALEQELISLGQRKAQFALSRTETLTAPVAGQLTALRVKPGDLLPAMTAQATIVPSGSTLQAELYAPPSALGYVASGQTVRVRVEPFPHQKFGTLDARVIRVSQVLETAAELGLTSATTSHVFKVIAELDRTHFRDRGSIYRLQPQMRLRGDIQLEHRRAWEWLMEPLLKARNR